MPVNDELLRHLAGWKDATELATAQSAVFVGDRGAVIDQAVVRKIFVEACDRAGVPQYRFHDLRRTFGSVAIRNADVVEVMHWMGHSRIETTAIYLQYLPQDDAAERLNGAWTTSAIGTRIRQAPLVATDGPT